MFTCFVLCLSYFGTLCCLPCLLHSNVKCSWITYMVADRAQFKKTYAKRQNTSKLRKVLHQLDNKCSENTHNQIHKETFFTPNQHSLHTVIWPYDELIWWDGLVIGLWTSWPQQDLNILNYQGPKLVADLISANFSGSREDAQVLDVACGPGQLPKLVRLPT